MYPILFSFQTPSGAVPLPTYGLMMTMAILAASLVGHIRSQKIGLDADKMPVIYLICVTTGIAGARLLHFMMSSDAAKFWKAPWIYFDPGQGGLAVYGGLIGGFLGAWLYCMRSKMPFWKVADVMGPAVILGVCIGRIGCFFAGCCHGQSCPLPADSFMILPPENAHGQIWLTGSFPYLLMLTKDGMGVNDAVVYPTQLWESAATFTIFLLSSISFRLRRFDGQAVATVMALYAIWRPINEHMRGDAVRGTDWMGLTTSQVISIPVFLGAILILALRWSKGVEKEIIRTAAEQEADIGEAPRF